MDQTVTLLHVRMRKRFARKEKGRKMRGNLQVIILCLSVLSAFSLNASTEKGKIFYQEGNYEKAVQEYLKGVKLNDAKAQNNLGNMYERGRGVKQDKKKAAHFYRLAAEQNHAPAQYNLGVMLYTGMGIAKDIPQAHMWMRIAISNGFDGAIEPSANAYRKMTIEEREISEERIRRCIERGLKGC